MFELSTEEALFLEALGKKQVRFMIVGLTSALLQNAHVVTQDIDLWVEDLSSEKFSEAVASVGGFYIPPGVAGLNPPMLAPSFLKIFDLVTNLQGLKSFDEEYAGALICKVKNISLHILPLERVIASKQTANRQKDIAVLPALKAALAVQKAKTT